MVDNYYHWDSYNFEYDCLLYVGFIGCWKSDEKNSPYRKKSLFKVKDELMRREP